MPRAGGRSTATTGASTRSGSTGLGHRPQGDHPPGAYHLRVIVEGEVSTAGFVVELGVKARRFRSLNQSHPNNDAMLKPSASSLVQSAGG